MTEPCLSCGACCASLVVSFHRSQLKSEGGYVPDELAVPETLDTCRMRGTDAAPPRCEALDGELGVAVSCSIYEQRPDPCRDFMRHGFVGYENDSCNRARRRMGLPVFK